MGRWQFGNRIEAQYDASRVDDAAKYIDLDRLAISPQCGFASTVAGNPVTEAAQRDKLHLVVKACHTVWS
jgi:5-methyltetrahydropteroyltriglutamate--homocysteine methyltransferase